MPRGYPRQEVPVGSSDALGMCLTTDIRTRAYQARNRPVCSRMLTFLGAIGSGIGTAAHIGNLLLRLDEPKTRQSVPTVRQPSANRTLHSHHR